MNRHFEFNVMPFGLTNAPVTLQRLMECVLPGLTYELCLIYLDDIIVFSSTFDKHLRCLRDVLVALRDAHLQLKLSQENLNDNMEYNGVIPIVGSFQSDGQ